MKTIYATILPAIIVLLLPSCVKDDLYRTDHPTTGAVTVTADWTGISSEAAVPESYNVSVGTGTETVSGTTNTLKTTFAPGTYEVLVHSRPRGITLSGDIATVNPTENEGEIHHMPEYLFSGIRSGLAVEADASVYVTVRMRQLVRRLDIELNIVEGDHSRLVSASATLSGVESQVNFRSGTRAGKTASVSGTYARDGARLSFSCRLLGVVHASAPKLVTTLVFTDGHTQTIESDISADLADFHDHNEPLKLAASLSVPVKSGVPATITDWRKVDGGNVDAH